MLTIPQDIEEEAVKTSPIHFDPQVDEYIEDDIDIKPNLVDSIAHQPPKGTKPAKLPDIKDKLKKKTWFDKQLQELETQVQDLKTRRDDKTYDTDYYKKLDAAYDEANKLHGVFKVSGNKYFNKEISHADFKKASNDAIVYAKPILETHRGWKEVFDNIGKFLNNLLGSIFKEKITFFQVDTTSIKKVKALEESVDKAAPEAKFTIQLQNAHVTYMGILYSKNRGAVFLVQICTESFIT